jgi:hypothetical protein
MQNKLLTLTLFGLLCCPISQAIAATQSFNESQVQGETGKIATIKMALNVGVPIKMPSGSTIYKGWLDNHTLAEIDGDRPFESGANIIYLVGRTTGVGKLSLMVRDQSGGDKLYVFRIVTGGRTAPDMVIVKGSSSPAILVHRTFSRPSEILSTIRAGLAIAESDGQIPRGSELWNAVESFNGYIEQGLTSEQAAQRSGCDLAVIKKLVLMAQGAAKQTPNPLPVPTLPKGATLGKIPPAPETQIAAKPQDHKQSKPAIERPRLQPVKTAAKPKKVKPKTVARRKPLQRKAPPFAVAAISAKKQSRPVSDQPLSTHAIANGLVRGLLSPDNKQARRGSGNFYKVQSVVTLLRRGKTLEWSCQRFHLSLPLAQSILKMGHVDISGLGGSK